MARNLENSTSENSNIQEMGPRRSTRLNVIIGGAASLLRGSTMATTAVATTRDKVHGTTTTTTARAVPLKQAQAMPLKQAQAVPSKAHGTKAMTQAMSLQAQRVAKPSHSLAPTCATR